MPWTFFFTAASLNAAFGQERHCGVEYPSLPPNGYGLCGESWNCVLKSFSADEYMMTDASTIDQFIGINVVQLQMDCHLIACDGQFA